MEAIAAKTTDFSRGLHSSLKIFACPILSITVFSSFKDQCPKIMSHTVHDFYLKIL
jgi:hypothetical protein